VRAVLPWLAAACGGALYFLAFVGFGIWPLAFVFVVPLWWALERLQSPGRAAAAGLLFGLVAHTGGHLWLWRLVDVFLGGDVVLGGLLWALHALWFAAGFAAYAVVFVMLRARGRSFALAGIAPLVVLEWLQVQIFPVYAGACLSGVVPLMQIADLGGPLLLSAFVAAMAVTVYESLAWIAGRRGAPLHAWAIAGVLVTAVWGYGTVRVRALDEALRVEEGSGAPRLRVGLVQANLDVLEKRESARATHEAHLALTRELLAEGPLDLVIWPETAELRAIRGPLPVSGRFVREGFDVPLLFGGTLLGEAFGRRARSNAALLVGADGMIRDAYRKNLLIPLAESIPFGRILPAMADRLPHAQEFLAAADQPVLSVDAFRIATPICYEAVRPSFVRRMVQAGSPNLLVTIANDAWFGDSQEPRLHLQLARLRAVEHRRFLVRSTNSGISALIDPAGRIVARTALGSRETLRGTVVARADATLYGRFGSWPGMLAAVIVVLGFVPFLQDRAVRR
jgi:apolipoprotein N-acyltransferase